MNNNSVTKTEEFEIDLIEIAKLLWSKVWIIVIAMVVMAAILFSYAMIFITPTYKSSAKMYVNNTSFAIEKPNISISASELTAAKSLLEVYVIILKTRLTLERVIDELKLDYTYEQLYGMVSANSVNSTEVFEVSVTGTDPAEAERIVSKIVEVLPERISEVVEGSSVRLVDHAVIPVSKQAPNCTKYAIIGLLLGALISCGAIIISYLLDDSLKGEEYLAQKYNIPILAIVPDAYESKGRYYNKKYYKRNYYNNYAVYGNYGVSGDSTNNSEDETEA